MDIEIKKIPFDELSPDLRQEVIDHFLQDPYRIEDDWYDWLWEDFINVQEEKGFYIDEDSLKFDLSYGRYVEFKGYVDEDNKNISKLRSKVLDISISTEWVSDIDMNFENGELSGDYKYEEDLIYEELETEMFGIEFGIIEPDPDAEIEIEISYAENAYDVVKKYDIDVHDIIEYLENLKQHAVAAEIFFQETIMVPEDEHIEFMESVTSEFVSKIENDCEEYIDAINELLTESKDKLVETLSNEYDYLQSEEYAIAYLENRIFEVEFDENGEQYSIEDLQGELL